MAFDLSSVIGQATEVASHQDSGDNKTQTRVIYPGTGTLRVKILYNPKSNLVARQIRRHKVANTNYTCLSMYNMECPICKAVDSIKNVTGNDPWQLNAKFRGLSYAQYVGSESYKWDNDNPEPKVGELILLMYPWTIYQDINRLISTAGPNASAIIASNKGKIVNILRWRENSQEKYKAELDAFTEFTSANSEEEFEKFLMELPDLNDAIVSATPNENVLKASNSAAETLQREYLRGTGFNGMPTQMEQSMSSNNVSGNAQVIMGANGQQYVLVNGQYVPIANQTPQMQVAPPTQQVMPQQITQAASPVQPQVQQVMSTPAQQVVQNPQVQQVPQQQFMNPPVESAPVNETPQGTTMADGTKMPDCFKCHKDGDPKCMSCIYEIQCMMNV